MHIYFNLNVKARAEKNILFLVMIAMNLQEYVSKSRK